MTRAELVRAVTDPAARAGVALEDGLVDVLLRDVAPDGRRVDGGGCGRRRRTSRARCPCCRSRSCRPGSGGAAGSPWPTTSPPAGSAARCRSAAERVFAGLGTHEKELARQLFTRLVAVGEETADVRRRVSHEDVDALDAAGGPGAGARDRRRRRGVRRCPAAHRGQHPRGDHPRGLVVAWPRLRTWLDEDRAGLILQRGLSDDAADWDRSGRQPDRLLHGPRLEALREWDAGVVPRGDPHPAGARLRPRVRDPGRRAARPRAPPDPAAPAARGRARRSAAGRRRPRRVHVRPARRTPSGTGTSRSPASSPRRPTGSGRRTR